MTGYDGKEAFRRTFERDKEELRQLRHPHHHGAISGAPRGARLPDRPDLDYELPDPGPDYDELAALRLALQAVRGGAERRRLRGPLEAQGGIVFSATAELGVGRPTLARSTRCRPDPSLVPLFSAVLERRVARFTYVGGRRRRTRKVDSQ